MSANGNSNSSTTVDSSSTVATPSILTLAGGATRHSIRRVRCQTTDGEVSHVDEGLLYQSKLFRQMYTDLGMAEMDVEEGDFELPLEMSKQMLDKIVVWCEYHKDKEDPKIVLDELTHERKWFDLDEFQRNFLKLGVEELASLLTAANFLDLSTLYLYGAQAMADKIRKAATPEAIRELFNLEDDFTSEEKEEISHQNVWCNY